MRENALICGGMRGALGRFAGAGGRMAAALRRVVAVAGVVLAVAFSGGAVAASGEECDIYTSGVCFGVDWAAFDHIGDRDVALVEKANAVAAGARDADGNTPLHYMVFWGDDGEYFFDRYGDVVDRLIADFDVNARNARGGDRVASACGGDQLESLRLASRSASL